MADFSEDFGEPFEVDLDTEQRRLQEVRETKIRNGMLKIMGDPDSRAWLWALLEECLIFHPIYSSVHATMALNEGKRQIGLKVLGESKSLCPREYIAMEREAAEV